MEKTKNKRKKNPTQNLKTGKTHTCLVLHEFRKQNVLKNCCICSKCQRLCCKELLVICDTPRRVWQKLDTDLFEHRKALCDDSWLLVSFFPSNSAKLHIIQRSSEWLHIIFARPPISLFWTQHNMQGSSKTAEDYGSHRSCNLCQMYVWLT